LEGKGKKGKRGVKWIRQIGKRKRKQRRVKKDATGRNRTAVQHDGAEPFTRHVFWHRHEDNTQQQHGNAERWIVKWYDEERKKSGGEEGGRRGEEWRKEMMREERLGRIRGLNNRAA
jgi:hypothetical protein